METYLTTFLIIGVAISNVTGECKFTLTKRNGHILCTNITSDDYLTSVSEIKATIVNIIPTGELAKIAIDIANSHVSVIDDWLFLPWDDQYSFIQSIKIVNSSVTSVKPLSKLSIVETLNIGGNNISDYRFLNKMKKLRQLYLSHSRFSSDSNLFSYLQREQSRLNLIDLSHCNLKHFGVISHLIDKYDLSFNPNLTSIQFNHSVGPRSPFLNLSGINNIIKLQHLRAVDSFCLSLDLSNSSKSLDIPLLNKIHISEKLLLNNNNIPNLNESTFNLSKLISEKCPGRISLDISNSRLTQISPNFFSSLVLNCLNLSNNNLSTLKGSIFRQSDILKLDLSNSNITSITPSVFNYLIVDTLDLSRNNMESVDGVFDYIESMRHLDISSNPIDAFDQNVFKNCRNLETLNLANVFVNSFAGNPFLSISSLKTLTLSSQSTMDPVFTKNMHVTELILTNTTLVQLNAEQFNGFYKLKKLSFVNSSVSVIDNLAFKGLFSLKRINYLKELGHYNINVFQQLYSLEYLDLSNHDLKKLHLELKDLYSLKKLNLSSNSISSVDVNSFVTLKHLEILSLSYNQLSIIVVGTFRQLSQLTHLYLNNNNLQQLPAGSFSGLHKLLLLDLSQNNLLRTRPQFIFGVSVPHLSQLYLQGNGLGNEYAQGDDMARQKEFTMIANHFTIKYIDINNNGWRCRTLIDVLTVFENKNVTYTPTNPEYLATNINGIGCI